ncbi:hypothetical protein ATN89_12390 [Comamonas thiooxydans]|uniref:hypothetical protein n=1 Tax=Comamonas thiooxydans TaxID=363952 RepID=UPI0007C48DDA|nr:hypothetical protein [Comamonas thiooxydans]OAD83964.1 hypothetical protein ATN89_12390 [Comamonas thiooxydans]
MTLATSAATVGLPEDKAYIAHHFNCPTCCAAGRSGGKQARCAVGQQLWDAYNQATHLFSHPKQKAPNRGPNYSNAL